METSKYPPFHVTATYETKRNNFRYTTTYSLFAFIDTPQVKDRWRLINRISDVTWKQFYR